ncbi:N-acetylmuramoyl-L-alanine amidase [Listeria ivanovii]|uniref:N-acetylmuramoyl-L-alanine amidase n=1 Tax=Listeria ivanovii TaxID=1638 RepID=UPI00194471C8|nr:N-acetylmuramoyl-L-alanine amidase [Listeria ivanovii]MBM5706339.1 hypothetical protein [Listeria ivanovii]
MPVLKNNYIIKNKYSRPGLKLLGVKKIVMHYTANPGASADNHKRYFGSLSGRYASAHIFVDDKESICIIPLNEVAYHANEKACKIAALKATASYYHGGNANLTSIGVEMCIDKKGKITTSTFNRAVDVVAELCKTYKLKASDIIRHYDVTGKNCPAPWVSKSSELTRFRNAVNAKMNSKSKKGKQWVYAHNALSARVSADWNSKVAFTAYKFQAFQVNWDVEKNGFYEVILNGKKGFMKSKYFTTNKPFTTMTTKNITHFRVSPDWDSKTVYTLKKGEKISVSKGKETNGFIDCFYRGKRGYIKKSYLK